MTKATLDIIGADANNLRNVDVEIPLERITVVTGVSGSGKSSLLTDTLAVEADRRMRTFLGIRQPQLDGPPPHAFVGPMPAAIHVGQRAFRASARTTVGTATGLLTTLRRLFVVHAKPTCDELGRTVPPPSPASYATWLVQHYRGRATIWAVPARYLETDGVRQVKLLSEHGLDEVVIRSATDSAKVWEAGRKIALTKFKPLRKDVAHILEAMVGAVDIKTKAQEKSLEVLLTRAFAAGQGQVVVELPDAAQVELQGPFGPRLDTALHYVDPDSPHIFAPPSAHLLSFNAPDHPESGACKTCLGLGRAINIDQQALVAHPERSMHEGAFALWTAKNYKYVNIQHATIEGLRGMHSFSPDTPWKKLSQDARRLVLDGAGAELVTDKDPKTGRKLSVPRHFEGFRRAILERYAKASKTSESLRFLVSEGRCPDCDGTRWSAPARALRVAGLGIHHLLAEPFVDLMARTAEHADLTRSVSPSAASLIRAVHHHATAFVEMGLGHLTGDRGMLAVSEGEGRRARLAAVLDAREQGLCILLDEPARGLHDMDVQTMVGAITQLASRHTLVISEHRNALNSAADHVIELGPGAGSAGGQIVYQGPTEHSSWAKETAIERIRLPTSKKTALLRLFGVTIHNLEGVDCEIPLGRLTCLAGVSGSGKSSLVRGALVPAVARALASGVDAADFEQRAGAWTRIEGVEQLKGLVALDQKTPPPNRRSIVATLLDIFDTLRTAFARSEPAKHAGLSSSDFGLNAGSGRCQVCLGIGEVAELDRWTTCPGCGGARYGQDVLAVRVDERNIREWLESPASELLTQLPASLAAHRSLLAAMVDLGIGHIALGRRVDTLSGGEVQRLRIAARLAQHGTGGLLFVLDEPAAGLHPTDVVRLVHALDRILDGGKNTIVLVEHNPAILHSADWIVEFGPGSGPHGGRVIASGRPDDITGMATATGRVLSRRPASDHKRARSTPSSRSRPAATLQQAERMKAWIRHILGDDITPPEPSPDGDTPGRPIAMLDDSFWRGRRPLDIGELDLEVARLLLDVHGYQTAPDEIAAFTRRWADQRDARLEIYPCLRELQVWGPRVPKSVAKEIRNRVESMGLELVNSDDLTDVRALRATGARFTPRDDTTEERSRNVRDALALGGGLVELRSLRGKLHARLGSRLADLEHGIVAPVAVEPAHFSRHSLYGQCPMCAGSGRVLVPQENLVIADPRMVPESAGFLHAAAADVMKGVMRNDLIPFLRRLADEGLWDRTTPYKRLDQTSRDMLLFGCWSRPGHGTFLKSAKEDPSEVGSWLRWDGLFKALHSQTDRSSDARWKSALLASLTHRPCPMCEGTGLAAQARLLTLAEVSLYDWNSRGDVGGLVKALEGLHKLTPRQRRTQQRLLACLAPLAKHVELLREPLDDSLSSELGRRVVENFTDMQAVLA